MSSQLIPRPAQSCFLACLLVVVIAGIESVKNQNLFWGPMHDSVHTLAAFLATALAISLLKPEQIKGLQLAQIGGALFAAGIAVELIQPSFGRSASFTDIYYNFVGIVAALAIGASRKFKTPQRIGTHLLCIFLIASSFTVPAIGALTLHKRNESLPSLLNFEESWQQRLYRAGGSANLSITSRPQGWENSSTTLKVDFQKTNYPGFSIPHIYPDWRGFDTIKLSVFSKNDEAQRITIRVHDEHHNQRYQDRYNENFVIQPGLNQLIIELNAIKQRPEGRDMDMENIAGLAMFSASPKEIFSLYFDDLRLE